MSELDTLIARIGGLNPRGRRALVAVAGAPGSGKSTLAAALVDGLGGGAALVPMDGFHLDNRVLRRRGLLARKGAPETFDAGGVLAMVRRLAADESVTVPIFDRTRDIAIAGAAEIGPKVQVAVVEGNYLLLDAPVWRDLRPVWDLSIFLDVPLPELERRLTRRWLDHGHSEDEARARVAGNDLPNARLVCRQSTGADLVVQNQMAMAAIAGPLKS